ncbi:MAG: hypothetical protein Q9181_003712 [Wetmoreana brouardii]
MPEEYGYLSVQFEIEQSRLRDFSQAAGLTATIEQHELPRAIQAHKELLLSILRDIRDVLYNFAKRREDTEVHANSQSQSLGDAFSSLARNDEGPEEPSSNLYTGLKWGIFDNNEFVGLLQRLRRSNNYLHEPLDGHQARVLQETQQETHMELVQVRDSVADLQVLAQASHFSRLSLGQSAEWQQKADLDLENLAIFKSLYASLLDRKSLEGQRLSITASHIRLLHSEDIRKDRPQAAFTPSKSNLRTVWIDWQAREAPDDEAIDGASLPSIAELTTLLVTPKPEEFRVPPCLGYCNLEMDGDQRLGLIFENSPHVDPQLQPYSLLKAIRTIRKPSLTSRVNLAHKIAQSLLYLHCVNWLHKGLRSENVLFFPTFNGGHNIVSPYLTGFGFSRRARFNEATLDVPRVGSMEVYRHPDIQMNGPRLYYRKTFDIYSLGIILIEIAHWRHIASIVDIEDNINTVPKATSGVRQRWLVSEPDLHDALRAEVGDRYASVVKTCVAGRDSFGIAKADLETSTSTSLVIQQGFNARVVKVLQGIVT